MKILYIDHPTPDLLSAILFKGLCLESGADAVIDYPWKALYHGYCYDGEGSVHKPFPWMTGVPSRDLWAQDAVVERISEFDLVVLASPREKNAAALQGLLARVGRQALRRFVMVDGEDYTTVRWDLVERFQPDVYFKLSMVPEGLTFEVYPDLKARLASSTTVLPLALACPAEPLQAVRKDIDVAFLGGNYWRPAALRSEGVPWAGRSEAEYKAALTERLAREFPSFVGSVKERPIPHSEFTALLNRSKVAVCVGGYGIEPMRTYEILGCPGTLLCRERIPVIATNPLVDGVHCVMFDTGEGFDHEEIVKVIRHQLEHQDERQTIAAAGNALLKKHYTPVAIARQFLAEAMR